MLKKIDEKDLLFTNDIEDDRTNTYLRLSDYDWMNYELETRFRTEEQGILEVCFSYFGSTVSTMNVTQYFPTKEMSIMGIFDKEEMKKVEHHYSYDMGLFRKHITDFLTQHINSWDSRYAFNGEDVVIAFFNDILENGYETDGKHLDVPLKKSDFVVIEGGKKDNNL